MKHKYITMEERKEKLRNFHETIEIPYWVTDDRAKTLHIAFIGKPGSGKSALINSMITAISRDGKYNEWSTVGPTCDGSHVTPALIRYPKEHYLWKEISLARYNYPTFVDIPGICEDDNQEFQMELLRLILFGKITEKDNYQEIFSYYQEQCDRYRKGIERGDLLVETAVKIKEYGLAMLREKYSRHESHYKIDRVVIVSTCKENETFPERLIYTVKTVCRSESRKIPLFGVLTHKDQAGSSYHQREEEFLKMLGIPRTRFVSCICHCDDYAKEMDRKLLLGKFPELDVPLLEFSISVCNPTTIILNEAASYTGHGMGLFAKIKAMQRDIFLYHAFLLGTIFLMLSSLHYKPAPFRKGELDDACRALDGLNLDMDFIDKLCTPETMTMVSPIPFPIYRVLLMSLAFLLESIFRKKCCDIFKKYILNRKENL